MYRNILVATDGSPLSDLAVDQAVGLAAALRARLVIMTVFEPFHLLTTDAEELADTEEDYARHMTHRADEILGAASRKAAAKGVEAVEVQVEANLPHEAIVATAARHGCDLIVMGSHGHSSLSALVLGSDTQEVLNHSALPVLVVRAPAQQAASAA